MRERLVETLLQFGLIVNPKDVDNPSLLIDVVEKGYVKVVQELLRYWDKINMLIDDYSTGLTPLHSAVKGKQLQMAKLLINYGANVNVKDGEGTTPIVDAIENRATEMVELLLNNGADIKEDPNLLGTAVMYGNLKIVKLLLKYGADVNMIYYTRCRKRCTPLQSAILNHHMEMAELLIHYGADVNIKDSVGTTPIFYAVRYNDKLITKLLLTNGADVNVKNGMRETPIFDAVRYKDKLITKLLLTNGANVNVKDGQGITPLHYAIKNGDTEITKLLLTNGANVNVKDGQGITPLHYTIKNGDTEMTKLLLTNGADEKDNPKLLRTAIGNKSLEIVECLLWHGIDINASDRYGRTALHYTVLDQWDDDRSLRSCKKNDSYYKKEIAELLLSKGANVNVASKNGITTLCAASEIGYEDIVEILVKYGAECDPRAEDVRKPLHAAAVGGHLKIIENLIKFGAEVDSRDIYGRTALHFASRRGHQEVVKTLLEYGSDVNIKSKKNHTPHEYSMFIEDLESDDEIDDYYYNFDFGDMDDDGNLLYVYDSPTTELLKQHMIKMKMAGLHVSYRNWQWITGDRKHYNFFIECEAEIKIMKSMKINNSHASFYDILTKNTSQLAKNESLVQALKSDDYKTKFPIYASMIDSRVRRGVERKELLVQVRDKFLKILPKLPLLCVEKIFSYLNDKDLRILLVDCKR